MQAIAEAVVEGYNDYLGELREQGGETLYSLTTFNTSFRHICVGAPLEQGRHLDHRSLPAGRDDCSLRRDRTQCARHRPPASGRRPRRGEGARCGHDGRARELLDRLRRTGDRGARAGATTSGRTGRSSTSVPGTRPSQTPNMPPRDRLPARERDALVGRQASTRKSMQLACRRDPRPSRFVDRKSERFFEDAGQSAATTARTRRPAWRTLRRRVVVARARGRA